MRWYDDPLVEGGTLTEGGVVYVVTRVVESRVPSGLGHAWMAPAAGEVVAIDAPAA